MCDARGAAEVVRDITVAERWSNAGVHKSSVLFSSAKPNYNSKLIADGVGKTTTIWA